MIESDGFFRAKELEAYEAMGSLDQHGETVRLILAVLSNVFPNPLVYGGVRSIGIE